MLLVKRRQTGPVLTDKKREGMYMSGQKKKGLTLARKQNLTGWVFLAPATLLIVWMSFYPMIRAFILTLETGMGIKLQF